MHDLINRHGHANVAMPRRDLPTYSNEHLRFWGNVYVCHKLHSQGIVFETFLQHPCEIIRAIKARGFKPLLKTQRAVREHLDTVNPLQQELEDDNRVSCRIGTFVEPMHHHTHPRHGIKH